MPCKMKLRFQMQTLLLEQLSQLQEKNREAQAFLVELQRRFGETSHRTAEQLVTRTQFNRADHLSMFGLRPSMMVLSRNIFPLFHVCVVVLVRSGLAVSGGRAVG